MEQLDEIYDIVDSMADNIRNGYDALESLDATIPDHKNLEDVDSTVDTIKTKLESCRNILVDLGAGSPTDEGVDAFEEALEYAQGSLDASWRAIKGMGIGSGDVTLDKLNEAVSEMMVDLTQIWNALEEKGATAPFPATITGIKEAINAIDVSSGLDMTVGQYGRLIYTATNEDGETELVPVQVATLDDFNALCNNTNSATAEITVNGHTFQKQQVLEFTSAAMPDSIPNYFLYRFENMSLGSIKVPSNVTAIGDYFMANCWVWNTSIDYSNATNLTSIGTRFGAWQYCYNKPTDLSATQIASLPDRFMQSNVCLNSIITLPSTITSIGNYVLAWSFELSAGADLVIPDSVISIGNYFLNRAFCFNAKLTVGSGVKTIGNFFLFDCRTLNTEIQFNCSVQTVGNNFMGNTSSYDKNLILSGDDGTIGNRFMSGTSMNNANLASDADPIAIQLTGTWASIGTDFLLLSSYFGSDITINGNGLVIGDYFAYKLVNFTTRTVTITGSTSGTLGAYFLANCAVFNGAVTIADGITSIGNYFMRYCCAFDQTLAIPTTVTTIGNGFMYGCMSLTKIPTGMSNVVSLGTYYMAYAGAPLTYISRDQLPQVTTVGNYYRYMSRINSAPALPYVTSIGTGFCFASRVIDISEFSNYTNLTSLGDYCFAHCSSIQAPYGSLSIPSSLSSLPNYFMYNAYNFNGVVYITNSTLVVSSNYSFSAFNNYTCPLYSSGVIFTGTGGSMAQMTLDSINGTNSLYRKTSYVSS